MAEFTHRVESLAVTRADQQFLPTEPDGDSGRMTVPRTVVVRRPGAPAAGAFRDGEASRGETIDGSGVSEGAFLPD